MISPDGAVMVELTGWRAGCKIFLPLIQLIAMVRGKKLKSFNVGDKVYARFFGKESLVVEGVLTETCFPHYICSIKNQKYVIPKIHLSTKPLENLTELKNHKQLAIKI